MKNILRQFTSHSFIKKKQQQKKKKKKKTRVGSLSAARLKT